MGEEWDDKMFTQRLVKCLLIQVRMSTVFIAPDLLTTHNLAQGEGMGRL